MYVSTYVLKSCYAPAGQPLTTLAKNVVAATTQAIPAKHSPCMSQYPRVSHEITQAAALVCRLHQRPADVLDQPGTHEFREAGGELANGTNRLIACGHAEGWSSHCQFVRQHPEGPAVNRGGVPEVTAILVV